MLQIFGINQPRHYSLNSKADRQRLHAHRLQAISQVPSFASTSYSRTSNPLPEVRYARESLAGSHDRREQERIAAKIEGLAFTHNPAAIKAAHEQEQRRLVAVEREIKAEIRQRSWTAARS